MGDGQIDAAAHKLIKDHLSKETTLEERQTSHMNMSRVTTDGKPRICTKFLNPSPERLPYVTQSPVIIPRDIVPRIHNDWVSMTWGHGQGHVNPNGATKMTAFYF